MKGWMVNDTTTDDDAILVFADNRSTARLIAGRELDPDRFIDLRAVRFPKMDDKPDTNASRLEAGLAVACVWCGEFYGEQDLLPSIDYADAFVCECCHDRWVEQQKESQP